MINRQLGNPGPHARAVLHHSGHLGGVFATLPHAATRQWTQAVLGHLRFRFRHVKHRPAVDNRIGFIRPEEPSAAWAALRQVELDIVRLRHPLERVALMPYLPAVGAFPLFGQARLDRLFLVPVATRWFVAVRAVQSQITTQLGVLSAVPGLLKSSI